MAAALCTEDEFPENTGLPVRLIWGCPMPLAGEPSRISQILYLLHFHPLPANRFSRGPEPNPRYYQDIFVARIMIAAYALYGMRFASPRHIQL